jgi:hypothetical protein
MVQEGIKDHEWRTGLSAKIPSGPSEAIDDQDCGMSGTTHDGQPRIEIAAEEFVLCRRMSVELPERSPGW